MELNLRREQLLTPLQAVIGVVERRQTMPILSNVLIEVTDGRITLTASDLTVELRASGEADTEANGRFTVSARKLMDICRSLDEGAPIQIQVEGDKATLRSGRSRFTLATLPAEEYPLMDFEETGLDVQLSQPQFKRLLEKTHFAMAVQDIRAFLNGMLVEVDGERLRCVATDGHRLALCEQTLETPHAERHQSILPRKAVLELARTVTQDDTPIHLRLGKQQARIEVGERSLTTKLINSTYPDYQRVIPRDSDKTVHAPTEELKQTLSRASILSNEKYRGIRLRLSPGQLTAIANNPEQEQAEDVMAVDYVGKELEIGFNVNYLLDALQAIDQDQVEIHLSDPNSSVLIQPEGDGTSLYVVMPMRL